MNALRSYQRWQMTRMIVLAACLVLPLSGCIAGMASIVMDAERERLADLERFKLDVAAQDCDGLSGMFSALVAEKEALTDFDQRSEIVLDAIRSDGCALPEGADS